MNMTQTVPPTEPQIALQSVAPPPAASSSTAAGGTITPELCMPEIGPDSIEKEYWAWFGLTLDCPLDNVDVGGIGFPKVTQAVSLDDHGKTTRRQLAGVVRKVTEAQLRKLAHDLRGRVLRTLPAIESPIGPTPPGVVDVSVRPRSKPRATIVRIPSQADRDAATKSGLGYSASFQRHVPALSDCPLINFIYVALLPANEVSPRPRPLGVALPPTVRMVGIQLPDQSSRSVPADEVSPHGDPITGSMPLPV